MLSIDPERTESVCEVEAVKLESPRTLIRSRRRYLRVFREADACIVTGGTPFYDYGHMSRIIHMGLPALVDKKLVCFGVGSKPITSLKGREITRVLVSKSQRISTRDERSKTILQSLVKPRVKGTEFPLNVTGDSALMMAPDVKRCRPGKMVVFCPRRLTSDHRSLYHERLNDATIKRVRHMQARAADSLVRQGLGVSFMPFHTVAPDDDREEIRNIRNLMTEDSELLPRPSSPMNGLETISGARMVVGLRLHSLVLASSCGVPFTTVDYDIKMRGFMEHMGLDELCVPSTGRIDRLTEISLKVSENHGRISRLINRRISWMRERITDEAKTLAKVLDDRELGKDRHGHLLRDIQTQSQEP